ncbi:hypothetical protein [Mycobacterium sp. E1747]|uniref:hypothetical protein n=1 Tax=Mycobacterium sp. E1747 TaxID=1834128 RepID=UPI0007FBBDD1|nr:hypothetical protein [Mycobacterium sp. E1747]OBH03274.1 hypothetical protein A5695_10405 [Mycobacterium sp. E1747]
MAVIRVKSVPEFRGEDVVLLAADRAGLDAFSAALTLAQQRGSSQLQHGRRVHEFVIEATAANIELSDDRVTWRLDDAKAGEIIEKAQVLAGNGGRPGHHYVDDMSGPAPTLVLSLNEYLSPSWLTAGKEPIFDDDAP